MSQATERDEDSMTVEEILIEEGLECFTIGCIVSLHDTLKFVTRAIEILNERRIGFTLQDDSNDYSIQELNNPGTELVRCRRQYDAERRIEGFTGEDDGYNTGMSYFKIWAKPELFESLRGRV